MKKTIFILIGLTLTILTNGQVLKVQGGTSISNLDWNLNWSDIGSFYTETLVGYSFFAGIDYFDKQYFNLSSNIGLIRKGGKAEVTPVDQNGEPTGETIIDKPILDYLSINTTVDIKYRIKETITPFISFGPRLDYLVNSSEQFDGLKEFDELNSTSAGLLLGGGIKYDISKIQFGLRADYYLDFTKVADWTIENTENIGEVTVNTFTINLSLGFRLK